MSAALEQPGVEPVAYIHRHGNYWEVSEGRLLDDEKERGWTEEPLFTAPKPAQQAEADKLLRQALEAMEVQGSEWVILEQNAIAAIRKYLGEA